MSSERTLGTFFCAANQPTTHGRRLAANLLNQIKLGITRNKAPPAKSEKQRKDERERERERERDGNGR